MTCHACGEHPKKHCGCKDCTRAVMEITNPEKIILLRKVVVPATMGDDTEVPASVGKYCNVVLWYEANKHTYIYSSDGIPTLLEAEVPQEVWDKIANLEEDLDEEIGAREDADVILQENIDAVAQDLEDLKNNPDVVDVVSTYADLQAYDTSTLTDKDVIRVLTDETHNGDSAYYRWDKTSSQWTFIGVIGPYYTESEIDTMMSGKQNTLTAGANITISGDTISATDTTYNAFVGTDGQTAGVAGLVPAPATTDAGKVLGASGAWVEGIEVINAQDWSALWQ